MLNRLSEQSLSRLVAVSYAPPGLWLSAQCITNSLEKGGGRSAGDFIFIEGRWAVAMGRSKGGSNSAPHAPVCPWTTPFEMAKSKRLLGGNCLLLLLWRASNLIAKGLATGTARRPA